MQERLSQRAPAAGKEQSVQYRKKPLSRTLEPLICGDIVTGAPVTELEYKHSKGCRT